MNLTYTIASFLKRKFALRSIILSSILAIMACSPEENTSIEQKADSEVEVNYHSSTFKGIFATRNAAYRGTFYLEISGESKDLSEIDKNSKGQLTLSGGATYTAKLVSIENKNVEKSSDVMARFDSEDFSFTFSYDTNGNPQITDVVFKKQEGAVVVAEETNNNSVTPITGTYNCTNCQDQDSNLNGIELNNEKKTFNMLLTTADGSTSINIQALIGSLLDTKIVVNENCETNNDYTFCTLTNGENAINENLEWSAVHRYTTRQGSSDSCSNIAGAFSFNYGTYGTLEGVFDSDSTCAGKTYFISATGNDNNTGLSPDDAWQNIARLNSIDIQPGDEILFKGGEQFQGNIYLDSNDANNSANPILISSYGTGRALIKAGNEYGIYAYNTAGVKIDNLIIEGSGMHVNTNSGISFYNDLPGDTKLDLIEVTNSEVYGFKDFGIVIGAYNGNSGFTNVLIENNKVHDCLDVGISSYGQFSSSKSGYAHSNISVRSCEVYNIKGYNKNKHSGNGIVLSDVQNSIIEHSTVYNCGSGNTSCGGPVGIWYWDADEVTIQFSEVYNMSSGSGCDGGGFDLDGGVTNGLMQYNYSHDNDGAGFMAGQFTGARPMQNITIRYNVSQNDAATNGGSVYLFNGGEPMSDINVYNNTLFLSEQTTNTSAAVIKYIQWNPVKDNMNFFNNILYAANGADLINIPSGYDGYFAGNLYYSSSSFNIVYKGNAYTSLESFRNTGNEIYENLEVGYEGVPLLKNSGNAATIGFGNALSSLDEYLLQSSSPAINTGIVLSDSGSRDFYGNLLDQTFNIGADQTEWDTKNQEMVSK